MNTSTITYVTAPWCAACHATLPLVKAVALLRGVSLEVLDLGIKADEDRAVPLAVTALPTIVGHSDGLEVWRLTGAVTRSALDAVLR